jgi:hypothetical protein
MKPKTVEKLRYFEDKVCTIFIPVVNRQFDEETARRHFIIRVKEVDVDGVWGTNLTTGTVCFFAMDVIQSIQEELELNPKDPQDMALIEQCTEPVSSGDATFIDIEALSKLAAQTKKAYDLIN